MRKGMTVGRMEKGRNWSERRTGRESGEMERGGKDGRGYIMFY